MFAAYPTAPSASSAIPIPSANATSPWAWTSTGTTTLSTTSTFIDIVTVSATASGTGYSSPAPFPTGTAPYSAVSEVCAPTTTTVTEKETVYVTLVPTTSSVSAPTVGPIQSSSAVYYPSGPASAMSGTASSTCLSTGFITIHKPSGASTGLPLSTATVYPTGYAKYL